MATTPTNLPVPSESPFDFKFNIGKIDEVVTSMGWTYTDRFGVQHYTIEGMRWLAQQAIAAFGYITLDSFEDGNTLTLPNQVLRLEATGEYYRWDGAFPKDVPAGSTPDSTGGVGVGKWLSVGDATLRSDLAKSDGMKLTGQKVNYGIPSGSSLTRGLIWAFDKIKGWLRVGGSDLAPLDDEKNFWRGLPTQNAWGDDSNIGSYSVAFNRNNAAYAVYSAAFGHDCIVYGAAGIAGGAGSCVGDPDNPTIDTLGYCSIALGKNCLALGGKTASFNEATRALSRAAFAAGYLTEARDGLSTDPGSTASEGIGATALGAETRAAGWGAFSAGKYTKAYGGSAAIGSGLNDVYPGVNPVPNSIMLFGQSQTPGLSIVPRLTGDETRYSNVGFHTKNPIELIDFIVPSNERVSFRIPGKGNGVIALQGTSNTGTALTIATLEWTSGNGGSAVGSLRINMNGGAQSIELLENGMVSLKNVKTLGEISGSPAGTVYKDAGNFLKIV